MVTVHHHFSTVHWHSQTLRHGHAQSWHAQCMLCCLTFEQMNAPSQTHAVHLLAMFAESQSKPAGKWEHSEPVVYEKEDISRAAQVQISLLVQ